MLGSVLKVAQRRAGKAQRPSGVTAEGLAPANQLPEDAQFTCFVGHDSLRSPLRSCREWLQPQAASEDDFNAATPMRRHFSHKA